MQFYGDGHDELHGGFNFVFINAPLEADALRAVVEETEALLPEGAWPIWTGSNHDVSRLATRWAGGDPAKVQAGAAPPAHPARHALPLPGRRDRAGRRAVQREDVLDAVGVRFWPVYKGRDAERTPMPWNGGPGGGFTAGGRPALAAHGRPGACNVADQEGDADSVLELCRRAIAARRASEDLAVGSYRSLPSPEGTWAYARGEGSHRAAEHVGRRRRPSRAWRGTVAVSTEHGARGIERGGRADAPALGAPLS